MQLRWVPCHRLPGGLFYFPKHRNRGGGHSFDSKPSHAITDKRHMSLVFPKSLRGHVHAAAVFPLTRSTVELFGWVASRPQQREQSGGLLSWAGKCQQQPRPPKRPAPHFPRTQPPPPRPISERGARKTDVGKTYCIIPYATSVPKLIGWAE